MGCINQQYIWVVYGIALLTLYIYICIYAYTCILYTYTYACINMHVYICMAMGQNPGTDLGELQNSWDLWLFIYPKCDTLGF